MKFSRSPKRIFFINAVKFFQPSQRIFFYTGRGSAGVFPVSQWKSFLQKKVHLPQVIHFSLKNCINITTNISVRLSVPYIFLFRGKFVLTNSSTPSMQPVRNLRQMPEFSSVFWFFSTGQDALDFLLAGYLALIISGIRLDTGYESWRPDIRPDNPAIVFISGTVSTLFGRIQIWMPDNWIS